MTTIKFGTDGWRGIIARDFTFDNVALCAQGVANYIVKEGLASRGLVVGYDTRFASEDFAAEVAQVLAGNGVKVYLSSKAAPTPTVTYNILSTKAAGAAIITASHNPGQWNGFKFRPEYAGSASPEVIARLEAEIQQAASPRRVTSLPLAKARQQGLVVDINPDDSYMANLARLVDLKGLRDAGLKVVVDVMHGAGAGYFPAALGGGRTWLEELRAQRNPIFPGMHNPEPIAHNLEPLARRVVETGADVGLAVDGDADRLGVMDEKGNFITTLNTFALLTLYFLEVRGQRGPLVRSVTQTSMIDRLGQMYGVPVFVTPVGFKYLGPVMMREKALIAGEESGGYAFRGNIPERDGIINGLMFLDLMVKTGKKPSELVQYLFDKVGPHYYDRWDIAFDQSQRASVQERVSKARPHSLAGKRVREIDTQDGYRFLLEGDAWSLVRFSGTEPLVRVYAEAESAERVKQLLQETRSLAGV